MIAVDVPGRRDVGMLPTFAKGSIPQDAATHTLAGIPIKLEWHYGEIARIQFPSIEQARRIPGFTETAPD